MARYRAWFLKRAYLFLQKSKSDPFKTTKCRKFSDNPARCIFSAIQPSGPLHIGNYLGAVKNWVNLQFENKGSTLFSIADLHSLTVPQEPTLLQHNIRTTAVSLLACGIDPNRCVLFQQSKVFQHTELAWILSCLTSTGHLNRMHHWKNKSQEQKASLGLYSYPVLMASDILVYRASDVPVGEDQLQHLELARELARIFNAKYGSLFPYPQPIQSRTPRVMSLRQPDRKMSKSDASPQATINLTDSPDLIRSKISKATTDSQPFISYNPNTRPGVANLINIFAAFRETSPADICKEYTDLKYFANKLKSDLTDLIVSELTDIRREAAKLEQNLGYVKNTLDEGRDKAREMAEANLKEVRKLVGLSYSQNI